MILKWSVVLFLSYHRHRSLTHHTLDTNDHCLLTNNAAMKPIRPLPERGEITKPPSVSVTRLVVSRGNPDVIAQKLLNINCSGRLRVVPGKEEVCNWSPKFLHCHTLSVINRPPAEKQSPPSSQWSRSRSCRSCSSRGGAVEEEDVPRERPETVLPARCPCLPGQTVVSSRALPMRLTSELGTDCSFLSTHRISGGRR